MKRLVWIAGIVAVVVASWFIYDATQGQREAEATLSEGIETATVGRQSIASLVAATGAIAPQQEQQLSFGLSGRVAKVLVEQGERLEAGQPLALLDDRDLQLGLTRARAAVAISEAQLRQAQAGPTPEEIERTEAAIAMADASVRSAQAGIVSARANLSRLQGGASAEEIAIAERQVDEAKNRLWGVQSQRDAVCGRVKYGVSQADCDGAEASVLQAEEAVAIVELQLQSLLKGARLEDIEAAGAQLSQAEAQLDQAQAQRTQAEADLARLMSGISAEDLAVLEAQVEQARVGVREAEVRMEDATLYAPMTGKLVSWSLAVGDRVSAYAPVGVLVNDASYHVLVSIDETDISQLSLGQEARIQLDAFADRALVGKLTEIGMHGANVQGIVSYQVRVDVDPADLEIKPLMTASVEIVTDLKEDVLAVPNRAIRRDARGRYVQVVRQGRLERVNIQTGISDAEYTEVIEGLEEGDEVVVSAPREHLFGGVL